MILSEDLIKIIDEVCFNCSKEKELFKHIELDNDSSLLIILEDILIRFSYNKNVLILEDIVFSNRLKGKQNCFNLIGKLIEYSKNSDIIEKFKVEAIISDSLYRICDYYNMEDISRTNYGEIDEEIYDFDGFYGDKEIKV